MHGAADPRRGVVVVQGQAMHLELSDLEPGPITAAIAPRRRGPVDAAVGGAFDGQLDIARLDAAETQAAPQRRQQIHLQAQVADGGHLWLRKARRVQHAQRAEPHDQPAIARRSDIQRALHHDRAAEQRRGAARDGFVPARSVDRAECQRQGEQRRAQQHRGERQQGQPCTQPDAGAAPARRGGPSGAHAWRLRWRPGRHSELPMRRRLTG
jgi:hypothetical protein